MKTDSIFYRIFQQFPRSFFELIDRPRQDTSRYQFTAVEVKQLSFRIDGIFLPISSNEADAPDTSANPLPFYLVEVQFQPDTTLYYRLFAELFLYLRQYRPTHPWQVVVIYPTRDTEREHPHQFQDLLDSRRVTRIYLDELNPNLDSVGVSVIQLVVEPVPTAIDRAKRLLRQLQQENLDTSIQDAMIDLIETIVIYKLPQLSREEIAQMLELGDPKQTRFYQEAFAEGRQEGRQEGQQAAKLEALQRLMRLGLNAEVIAEALDLPLDVVQQAIASASNE